MRKYKCLALIYIILMVSLYSCIPQPQLVKPFTQKPPKIRVLLGQARYINIFSSDGFRILLSDNVTINTGDYLHISLKGNVLVLNNYVIDAREIYIIPVNGIFKISGGKVYAGYVKIIKGGGKLFVINVVDIEEYLKGVVGAEMNSSWPIEALKAQAVASRTWALRTLMESKKNNNEWDVLATYLSQVYKGISSDSNVIEAVESTRGEVLVYNEEPIFAYFHSSSGGKTASAKEWKNEDLPYLIPVDSPDDIPENPHQYWSYRIHINHLKNIISAESGVKIKSIESVSIKEISESNRIKSITFGVIDERGKKLRITISGNRFRRMLGYKNLKSLMITRISFSGSYIEFTGKGWGHGVGLSQFGAKKLAEMGYDYKQILEHYYKNTQLVKLW